ncbi:hypothetical protein [Cellulomonas sp.]|uniref:hypothetical protein n=1 Tax=Cellulomonas sp. TaxID=40001 RepID=UPI003BA97D4E
MSLERLEGSPLRLDAATRNLADVALRDGCLPSTVLGTCGKRLRDAWVHYGLHGVPEGAVTNPLGLVTFFTVEPLSR